MIGPHLRNSMLSRTDWGWISTDKCFNRYYGLLWTDDLTSSFLCWLWKKVFMYVKETWYYLDPVKRICVFEHSVMTNFNCAYPAIQRGQGSVQGSGFLSECSSWLTACMSEQRRFWRDCKDAQARLNLRCSHRRYVPNSLDRAHFIVDVLLLFHPNIIILTAIKS